MTDSRLLEGVSRVASAERGLDREDALAVTLKRYLHCAATGQPARPGLGAVRKALRLLPDLLWLLPRLAADRRLSRRVRVGLALLLAYLALPFDQVPDFIPVLGYADDAIIVGAVLR